MPLRLFDLRQTLKYMYDSISLGDSVLIMYISNEWLNWGVRAAQRKIIGEIFIAQET